MEEKEFILTDEVEGVYAISLVESPAIESNFIKLSKEDVKFKFDEERGVLLGAALIPDKRIYRRNGDHEYNIYFSAETIRKVNEKFMMNYNQKETNIDHNGQHLNTNTVVETWIKEDEVHDKSVKFGLDEPVGTWFIMMKCGEEELKLAKEGKINGFSIEGQFENEAQLEKKLNFNQIIDNMSKSITERLEALVVKLTGEKEEIKLEQMTLANGVIIESENFEAGQSVVAVDEEGSFPLPVGEYELEDGRLLVVADEGIVSEIREAVAEEEEMSEAKYVTIDQFNEAIDGIKELLSKDTELKKEVEELKSEKEDLQQKLDEKPDAEKVKPSPEKKVEFQLAQTKKGRIAQGLKSILNK